MTLTAKILSSIIFAFVLAGCGQSGPLYVPGDPSSVRTPPQSEQADEDSEDENEDDDQ